MKRLPDASTRQRRPFVTRRQRHFLLREQKSRYTTAGRQGLRDECPCVKRSTTRVHKTYKCSELLSDVLQIILHNGWCEWCAGPWCIGAMVTISTRNYEPWTRIDDNYQHTDDRQGKVGQIIWPSDDILNSWAKEACNELAWNSNMAWSPTCSVCVKWDDGIISCYRVGGIYDPPPVILKICTGRGGVDR